MFKILLLDIVRVLSPWTEELISPPLVAFWTHIIEVIAQATPLIDITSIPSAIWVFLGVVVGVVGNLMTSKTRKVGEREMDMIRVLNEKTERLSQQNREDWMTIRALTSELLEERNNTIQARYNLERLQQELDALTAELQAQDIIDEAPLIPQRHDDDQ